MKLTTNYQLPTTSQKGFTLIEALVAVLIIGILGFMITDLLSRTFRGSNKTQLIGVVKQNGQSALNTIDHAIRNSDAVVCPQNKVADKVLALTTNGKYTVFWCEPPTDTQNGYIAKIQTDTSPLISGTNLCPPPTSPSSPLYPQLSSRIYLTNINPAFGVSVQTRDCFIRDVEPGSKDKIDISFEIGSGVNSGSGFENQIGEGAVLFETTVELR